MTHFTTFAVKVGRPVTLGNDGYGEARIVPRLRPQLLMSML